ncbi:MULTISPECIES: sporulation protein YjcZ [Bacillaceae]|uniref:Sporulation protein YjcZ n=1 Tax=Evansella alkalicola TaxID=745819 RepID=A0ABS6JRA9_9BACI|nr:MULTISPECIES: sporulation protein YjcZ [Bacillaceae]MBU9720955.1 sporulation protein YjcZ [Bacillus alkalicola]
MHTNFGGFSFILVVFVLLVIIGAVVVTPQGHGYGY